MMGPFPISCFGLARISEFSPRTSSEMIPNKPNKPLDFWYIAPHDRKTLTRLIMPYMAARIPRRHLLQTLLKKHTWLREILYPVPMQMEDVRPAYLQQTTASFWKDPRRTIAKLVKLTRTWFFTLLRYTYRTRFFEGSTTYRSDLDVPDIQSCEARRYISELTESEVHRLVCIPNKYGATFYRSSYKSVRQCSAWTRFCARIQTFCDSVGLFASPEDPDLSLKELQNNLTSVVLQQRWLRTAAHLEETAVLARGTERHVKELDKRVASAGLINLNLTKERKHTRTLLLQCNKLRSTLATSSHPQQCDSNVSAELQIQPGAWQKELQYLRSRIEESEAMTERRLVTLAEQIKKGCTNIGHSTIPSNEYRNVELLVACRWLLEHLPAPNFKQQGFGNRWRLFWQSQWKQYKEDVSRDEHPLRALVGNEKYNKVGKGLYGTLSTFLHEYGHLRIDPLNPDVQKVVETISPVHYNSNGQIDIEAERRRWLK